MADLTNSKPKCGWTLKHSSRSSGQRGADGWQWLVQLPASSRSIPLYPAPVNAWSVALRKVAEPLSQRGNLSREGGVFPGDLVQDGLAVPLANHWWEKYGKICQISHMVPTLFPHGSHMDAFFSDFWILSLHCACQGACIQGVGVSKNFSPIIA